MGSLGLHRDKGIKVHSAMRFGGKTGGAGASAGLVRRVVRRASCGAGWIGVGAGGAGSRAGLAIPSSVSSYMPP
jgi:hypothetical protein